jgi:phage gpG-like protein
MGVSIKGVKLFTSKLTRISKSVQKPNRALKVLGEVLLNKIQREYFLREGTEEGRWQPLSAATIISKGSDGILKDTGKLRQSFAYEVRGNQLELGSPLKYAEHHQQDYEGHFFARSDNIPKRPMLPSSRIVKKEGLKVINALLKKEIDKP